MRRTRLAVLMMTLCLLSACGGKEKGPLQAAVDLRAQYLERGGCTFHAEVTADLDDRVWTCALDCECREDETRVTVLAPETIAGISAVVSGDGGKLEYDGVSVQFDLSRDVRRSPLAAPGLLTSGWAHGDITSAGWEEDALLCVFELGYGAEATTVRAWFTADGVPLRAELAQAERVFCTLTVTNFHYDTGGNDETSQEDLG